MQDGLLAALEWQEVQLGWNACPPPPSKLICHSRRQSRSMAMSGGSLNDTRTKSANP
jgi:hypothetical protein